MTLAIGPACQRTPPELLIASGFWPTSANSISGIFVVQQVAAFARLGCRVTVLIPRAVGKRSASLLTAAELGLPAEAVCIREVIFTQLPEKLAKLPGGLRFNTFAIGKAMQLAIQGLKRKNKKFDACIAHGGRYSGMSLPHWRHLIDGNAVFVIHGLDPFFARSINTVRATPLFHAASMVVEAAVIVGKSLFDHARSLGIPHDRLKVVLNGCELPPLASVSAIQRERGDIRQVLSVSNLVEVKGIDLNLHALALMSKRRPDLAWQYRIVGDGPQREKLLMLAGCLGIADRVHFLGRLTYEKTMLEMAEADVFSLPSWREAFGIVYLEAMARMRPIIGCMDNGPAEFITNGKEGVLVRPQDVAELSATLERLVEHSELCIMMGLEGRRTAETMSWDHNAKQMLSIIGINIGKGQ